MSFFSWKFYSENYGKPGSKPIAIAQNSGNTIAHVYWRKEGLVVFPFFTRYFIRFKINFSDLNPLLDYEKDFYHIALYIEKELLSKMLMFKKHRLPSHTRTDFTAMSFMSNKYLTDMQKEELFQIKHTLILGRHCSHHTLVKRSSDQPNLNYCLFCGHFVNVDVVDENNRKSHIMPIYNDYVSSSIIIIANTKLIPHLTKEQQLAILLSKYWKIHIKYPNISQEALVKYLNWWVRQH